MRAYILLVPLLLAGCASSNRVARPEPLRITANHYQTMTGLTLSSDKDVATTCRRDLITGSHVLRWFCTFGNDPAQFLLDRHIVIAFR
jgi:nitrous oxide reductase accessory protein NosL